MTNKASLPANNSVLMAIIEQGIEDYFNECRARIPSFVKQHFFYPGAWHTNRRALGWDILRAPFNLLWVPFYIVFRSLAWLSHTCGGAKLAHQLMRIPSGMQTDVQRYLMTCAERELLMRSENKNRLRECIVAAIVGHESLTQLDAEHEQRLGRNLANALTQYTLTRTATADISNTLVATLAGAFTLQKFTPGGLAIGVVLAGAFANRAAAWDFILGPTLGGWYYTLFPVEPGASLVVLSATGVMALMAVFACFSGLISDPLQGCLGIHQRRLRHMLDSVERDFKRQTQGSFRPKDAYLARLMDIIDAARLSVT
ncbi:DUF6635 family protein [Gilvimarinus polysaccharolyticus]|uniref:DUF6635 family protein n=1 Tax=Gilvimarinus polysaccharolyticus TaxID=863921 RepID=UPI0006731507|nr:DUF6635 family protein [Gilvimarinus polysaccharolyticus]